MASTSSSSPPPAQANDGADAPQKNNTDTSSTSTQPPTNPASSSPSIHPLYATLPHRHSTAYTYRAPDSSVDHLIIGGGIVGLAIARALSERWPDKTTVLIERNAHVGVETSARGSKVLHAGIYYPPNSLKTRLCLRGKALMYEYCEREGLPVRRTGKLVVGPDTEEARTYLENLHAHAQSLHPLTPPTRLLTGDEARNLEPSLASGPPDGIGWALFSESTGIVGASHVVRRLQAQIEESVGGEVVLGTSVVRVDPFVEAGSDTGGGSSKRGADASRSGWVVQTAATVVEPGSGLAAAPPSSGSEGGEEDRQTTPANVHGPSESILARVLINASGLNANAVLNSLVEDRLLPAAAAAGEDGGGVADERGIPMYFAKGNYVALEGGKELGVWHLIYPMPDMGSSGKREKHAHQGLGTHLTLDMDGNIFFGPDVEWISPPAPTSSTKKNEDFWSTHLLPTPQRLTDMHTAITSYLPHISPQDLKPSWAGIRPKLIGPGSRKTGFQDFEVLWHESRGLSGQRVWQRALGSGGDEFEVGKEDGRVRPRAVLLFSRASGGSKEGDGPETTTQGNGGGGGAMISLLGIESPGLTSSMAIAELVEALVAQRVWGDHSREATRRPRRGSSGDRGGGGRKVNKGALNEEIGRLDDWA
ncbi:hypothetical protein V8E36_007583 [Tilletia maclaganii]